ncbi:TPA: DUF4145 domain-containing protein [Vibrio cholerae]|nr:DUF4145 domain-containing protein [Vibrio cholerae]
MKPGTLYSEEQIPSFRCPTCNYGDMIPVGEVSNRQSDVRSGGDTRVILRSDLLCQNDNCGEVGVIVMMGEFYSDGQRDSEMLFAPVYVNPAPNMFELHQAYPCKIRILLEQVFSLFWIDYSSCGNKLRIVVEELLSQQHVEQYRKNKAGVVLLSQKGHPKTHSLQQRLEQYKKRGKVESKCVTALEAIKWLGNESSHSGDGVFQKTVYQAIMVFGAVLEQIYMGKELPKSLEFSVSNINFFYHPEKQEFRPKK